FSGMVQSVTKEPMFGNARDFVGIAGKPVAFSIAASDATTVTIKSGSLPEGLTLDSEKKLISGVCAEDTDGAVALVLTATNQYGSVDGDFSLKINEASASINTALGSTAYNIINSTTFPWTGVLKTDATGAVRAVAESGRLVNGGSSSLRFASLYNGDPKRASAYYLFSFWWKASTEADHDIVSLRVGGAAVKDFVTGLPVRLSGETDWVQQTVRVPSFTYPAFEFVYSKDATLSEGRDRVYMYVDSFGLPPTVVNQPPAVVTNSTATYNSTSTIGLLAKVDGAESVVWMKDGVTLQDGTSSSGSIVSGANTGYLLITKASGADSGSYWLEARNGYGTVTSSKSVVTIGSVPVITQQLVAPVGLKVGDTLVLSVSAAGTNPLTYQWWKDGVIRASSSSATYQKAKITTLDSGSYSVRVSNGFGTAISTGVVVSVGSATTVTTGTLKPTITTTTTTTK
ncbi:MAG: immunoglobulin domain-containing protein, partial [Verrucomicrobiota bacterium]